MRSTRPFACLVAVGLSKRRIQIFWSDILLLTCQQRWFLVTSARPRHCSRAAPTPHAPHRPRTSHTNAMFASIARTPALATAGSTAAASKPRRNNGASTAAPTRTRSRSSVPPTRRTSAGARDRRPIPIPTMTSGPRSSDAPARGRSPRLSTNHRRESTRRRRSL
jgi:hypothetical protein